MADLSESLKWEYINYYKENKDKIAEEGEKDKFTVLKMKEKSDFITQLLKKYEIKKFFFNDFRSNIFRKIVIFP